MARKLKPVDNSPTCDPEYIRRIDPVWLSGLVPPHFWEHRKHCRDYMLWLGHRLGYRRAEDWYATTSGDFARNWGRGLLVQWYGGSVCRAVIDLVPAQEWCEWKFSQVPKGFWDDVENRRRYLCWLGKELGFHELKDWYRIRRADIEARRGQPLLDRFAGLRDLMREFLPQLDWDRDDPHRPIKLEDILAWADAYYARHGIWPMSKSGEIPEGGLSWCAIDTALQCGFRGLPKGSSLPKLLQTFRGVPVGRKPPAISEAQILAWADAHFAAHGKWPKQNSGAIAGTRETWAIVNTALYSGLRGLRGGGTLARLLEKRRDVQNLGAPRPLEDQVIVKWAKAHHGKTGRWPTQYSGRIPQSTGDTWLAIDQALRQGHRELAGGSSLAELLRQHGLK